jgi:hypothetical protein
MPVADYIKQVEDLTPEVLTVEAQTVDPLDNGSLYWGTFMPRRDIDSIKIKSIEETDFRPVGDNREWDGQGRQIPFLTPATREYELVPTEVWFSVGEKEIQLLREKAGGDRGRMLKLFKADIQSRIDELALACYRRLELNMWKAWHDGVIQTSNPKGVKTTMSLSFAATRIRTAGTAWDDGGVNAYSEFLTILKDSIRLLGGKPRGVVLNQLLFDTILVDAPNPLSPSPGDVLLTADELQRRVSAELGAPFVFVVIEETVDEFQDAGPLSYSETPLFAEGHLMLIPPRGQVGWSYFAPVDRAQDMAEAIPNARIDVRGVAIYMLTENDGKTLKVQAQLNVIPIPVEGRVLVIDTLVTA